MIEHLGQVMDKQRELIENKIGGHELLESTDTAKDISASNLESIQIMF